MSSHRPGTENPYALLLVAIVAHGANFGMATMAQSTEGNPRRRAATTYRAGRSGGRRSRPQAESS